MAAAGSGGPPEQLAPANWTQGEMIGQGAFGSVFLGMDNDTGQLMAVKQVALAGTNQSKAKAAAHIKDLESEVALLKDLHHDNIVRYLVRVQGEREREGARKDGRGGRWCWLAAVGQGWALEGSDWRWLAGC